MANTQLEQIVDLSEHNRADHVDVAGAGSHRAPERQDMRKASSQKVQIVFISSKTLNDHMIRNLRRQSVQRHHLTNGTWCSLFGARNRQASHRLRLASTVSPRTRQKGSTAPLCSRYNKSRDLWKRTAESPQCLHQSFDSNQSLFRHEERDRAKFKT